MQKLITILFLVIWCAAVAQVGFGDKAISPRVGLGLQKISAVEKNLGLKRSSHKISFNYKPGVKEGYTITTSNNQTTIEGNDDTGLLYGCLEFASRLNQLKAYPKKLSVTDAPEMVLRGQCIGLQKSTYLPGRNVYEYPYTPETFPWFYDKKLWLQVLDSMLENRMNSLYLWNGHPFASLVKLKDYPYAVEVDDATFKKNEEIYRFLTTEADKRGIWVIQMFYNIIITHTFHCFTQTNH